MGLGVSHSLFISLSMPGEIRFSRLNVFTRGVGDERPTRDVPDWEGWGGVRKRCWAGRGRSSDKTSGPNRSSRLPVPGRGPAGRGP